MQGLVFEVAGERYAIPSLRVVTVVRRPEVRTVPGVPAWVRGLFLWSNAWVPLIDVAHLLSREACPEGAASRVAIVEHVRGTERRAIGLLAPGMTRVVDVDGAALADGLHSTSHAYLGAIAGSDEYGVQLVDVDKILPPELDALLFGEVAG